MKDDGSIRCDVQVFKCQTLVDGGWRVALDGRGLDAFAKFAEAQQPGVILKLVAVAVKAEDNDEKEAFTLRN